MKTQSIRTGGSRSFMMLKEQLEDVLDSLTERREVYACVSGWMTVESYTGEVGQVFGVTRSVSGRLGESRKLRHPVEAKVERFPGVAAARELSFDKRWSGYNRNVNHDQAFLELNGRAPSVNRVVAGSVARGHTEPTVYGRLWCSLGARCG